MREFKFRMWCQKTKTMTKPIDLTKMLTNFKSRFDDFVANGYPQEYMPGDSTVFMQFTGLRDFFKSEIFEGDVVFLDAYMRKYEIVMDCGAWKMRDGGKYEWLCDWFEDLHVIGNIHQNPELIK